MERSEAVIAGERSEAVIAGERSEAVIAGAKCSHGSEDKATSGDRSSKPERSLTGHGARNRRGVARVVEALARVKLRATR